MNFLFHRFFTLRCLRFAFVLQQLEANMTGRIKIQRVGTIMNRTTVAITVMRFCLSSFGAYVFFCSEGYAKERDTHSRGFATGKPAD